MAAPIEDLFADRPDEFHGVLAYHYTKAEDWEKAQAYLLEAGDQAGSIAADTEALAHYRQAIEAHLRAHGGTWGDLVSDEGIDWFLEWTDSLAEARSLRSVVSAIKAFHENVSAALGPEDPRVWAVAVVLGRAYIQCGAPHETKTILESVRAVQDEVDGCSGADLIRTLAFLGLAHCAQDEFREAEEVWTRAMTLVRLATNLDACQDFGLVYTMLGSVYLDYGRWQDARAVIAEGLSRPELQAGLAHDGLLVNLSWLSWVVGDYEEAERYACACMAKATHPFVGAGHEDNLGRVRLAQGAHAEAEEHIVAAMSAAEPFGPTGDLVQMVYNLAETRLQAGRLEEAEDGDTCACTGERVRLRQVLDDLLVLDTSRNRSSPAGRLSRPSDCSPNARPSAQTDGGLPWIQPEIFYRKAQLRRLQGRGDESEDLVQEACRLLDGRRQRSPHPRAEAMRAEWTGSTPQ